MWQGMIFGVGTREAGRMTNDDEDGDSGGGGGGGGGDGKAFILLLVFVKGRNGITYALCSPNISMKELPSLGRQSSLCPISSALS